MGENLSTEPGIGGFLQNAKNAVSVKNNNRLTLLFEHKILRGIKDDGKGSLSALGGVARDIANHVMLNKFGIANFNDNLLFNYGGGPNAIVPGLTNSHYHRVTDTTEWAYKPNTGGPQDKSKQRFAVLTNRQLFNTNVVGKGPILFGSNGLVDFRLTIMGGPSEESKEEESKLGKKLRQAKNLLFPKKDNVPPPLPNSPAGQSLSSTEYGTFNRQKTYNLGDPGSREVDRTSPNSGITQIGGINTTMDDLNFYPVYSGPNVSEDAKNSDIIPFYITVIDNDDINDNVYLHFRAFLDSITDNYGATWNSHKIMGRGENFFTYGGYTRTLSLGFSVHAQSKPELKRMYTKLNYLASTMTPDYSIRTGMMRGNLIKLTIGDYLNDQPGILTGLSFAIDETTPWDIGRNTNGSISEKGLALPHLIKVTGFQFTPIQEFIPSKVSTKWVDNQIEQNMKSPFISLGKNHRGYDTSVKKGESAPSIHPTEIMIKDSENSSLTRKEKRNIIRSDRRIKRFQRNNPGEG